MKLSLKYNIEKIGRYRPQLQITDEGENLQRFSLSAEILEDIQQDMWKIDLSIPFVPDFLWAPHLAPEEGYLIDQHAFRCPALIAKNHEQMIL